jgi:hypothetical protein
MGRNVSLFALPEEVEPLVETCCAEHGWLIWEFPEGTMTGPIRSISGFAATSQGMVWVGPPTERVEWSSRDASVEAGFACVVRPSVVEGLELTLTEVFDVGSSELGRGAPFVVLRRALRGRTLGRVSAVASDGVARHATRIGFTTGAEAAWRSGVVLRQAVGGNVHFEPMSVDATD